MLNHEFVKPYVSIGLLSQICDLSSNIWTFDEYMMLRKWSDGTERYVPIKTHFYMNSYVSESLSLK